MKETLCWSCTAPGTGRCSWDVDLTPVDGWDAEATKTDGFDTFCVIRCPLYIKQPERKAALSMPIRLAPGQKQHRVMLTDALIQMFDRMGMSLDEVSAVTGVKSGIIYQRRLKLRKESAR